MPPRSLELNICIAGRYSKNMYIDVVLRSSSFSVASADAHDFIADSGGAIALLHGSMGTYEVVGVPRPDALAWVRAGGPAPEGVSVEGTAGVGRMGPKS